MAANAGKTVSDDADLPGAVVRKLDLDPAITKNVAEVGKEAARQLNALTGTRREALRFMQDPAIKEAVLGRGLRPGFADALKGSTSAAQEAAKLMRDYDALQRSPIEPIHSFAAERHDEQMEAQRQTNELLDRMVTVLGDLAVGQAVAHVTGEALAEHNARLTRATVVLAAAGVIVTILFGANHWTWWQTAATCAGVLALTGASVVPWRSLVSRARTGSAGDPLHLLLLRDGGRAETG